MKGSFKAMRMTHLCGSGAEANFSHILHCHITLLNLARMVDNQQCTLRTFLSCGIDVSDISVVAQDGVDLLQDGDVGGSVLLAILWCRM